VERRTVVVSRICVLRGEDESVWIGIRVYGVHGVETWGVRREGMEGGMI
jgi:hypothetical protein